MNAQIVRSLLDDATDSATADFNNTPGSYDTTKTLKTTSYTTPFITDMNNQEISVLDKNNKAKTIKVTITGASNVITLQNALSVEEGDCLNDGLDLCTYKIPKVSYKVSFEVPYSVYHDINPLTHVCSMCGYTDFSEYLEYELQNDNTYKVVGFSEDSLKEYSNIEYLIDIPSNYNGLEVSGISYNFGNNYLVNNGLILKVVGIPKTIIKIDKATFGHEGFYIKYDGSKDEWNEFVSNNNWIKVYKN